MAERAIIRLGSMVLSILSASQETTQLDYLRSASLVWRSRDGCQVSGLAEMREGRNLSADDDDVLFIRFTCIRSHIKDGF